MRVTIVDDGSPYYSMGLANALALFCSVTVVHTEAFSDTCGRLTQPSVKTVAFRKPKTSRSPERMLTSEKIFESIAATEPDLLHVQETFHYSAEFYAAFIRFPVLVVTIHDAVAYALTSHPVPGDRSAIALACWRAAHLIVHNTDIRKKLIANYGIPAGRVDIIPHGELGSLYRQLASRDDTPVERNPYGLLFFGNILRHRGLGVLLEAFSMVEREQSEAHLLVCGHGSGQLDQYEHLVQGSSISFGDRFVPEDRIFNLFRRSNLLILPYLEASQSALASIAFSTETLVIATRVGGFPEMMLNGRAGMLVEPNDPNALGSAIVQVLQSLSLQNEMRRSALALAESTLSWTSIAESTMYTYRVVLGSRRAGRR